MSLYQLKVDISFESETDHDSSLGRKITSAGQVQVKPTSTQVGEVCTMIIEGDAPAILAYLADLWQSGGEAIDELHRAQADGRLRLI
jgi:hypothetical protein